MPYLASYSSSRSLAERAANATLADFVAAFPFGKMGSTFHVDAKRYRRKLQDVPFCDFFCALPGAEQEAAAAEAAARAAAPPLSAVVLQAPAAPSSLRRRKEAPEAGAHMDKKRLLPAAPARSVGLLDLFTIAALAGATWALDRYSAPH